MPPLALDPRCARGCAYGMSTLARRRVSAARASLCVLAAGLVMTGCQGPALDRLELSATRTVSGPEAISDTGIAAAQFELAMPRAVVASESHVLVADQQNHRVVVFDHDLRPVRLLGRTGSGPGEIRSPVGLRLWHDTVAVGDQDNQRLTLFTMDGALVRTMSVPVRPARFVRRGATSVLLPNPAPGHYLIEVDTGGGSRALAPRHLKAYAPNLLDGGGQPKQYSGDLVAATEDGGAWVFDNAAGLLLRFTSAGELASALRLPVEFEAALMRRREEFVSALRRGGMNVVSAPLAKDLVASEDGRLLLLFTTETYAGLMIVPGTRRAAPLRLPVDSAARTPVAHARAAALRGEWLYVVDEERAYRYRIVGDAPVAVTR